MITEEEALLTMAMAYLAGVLCTLYCLLFSYCLSDICCDGVQGDRPDARTGLRRFAWYRKRVAMGFAVALGGSEGVRDTTGGDGEAGRRAELRSEPAQHEAPRGRVLRAAREEPLVTQGTPV